MRALRRIASAVIRHLAIKRDAGPDNAVAAGAGLDDAVGRSGTILERS